MLLYLTILMIFRQRNCKHFGKFVVSLKEQIQQILLNVFRKNEKTVFDTTKLSNRKPCLPIVKPNGLYTLPIYGKHKPLCFLLFPLYFRSFVSLSLSRSSFLCLFPDRPSFLARLTLLPPWLVLPLSLSFSLDSFVCFPIFFLSLQVFR
jgi:hypothetical protein